MKNVVSWSKRDTRRLIVFVYNGCLMILCVDLSGPLILRVGSKNAMFGCGKESNS